MKSSWMASGEETDSSNTEACDIASPTSVSSGSYIHTIIIYLTKSINTLNHFTHKAELKTLSYP